MQYSDSDEDEERSEKTQTLGPVGDSLPLSRNNVESNLKRKHDQQEEELPEM